MAEPTPFDVRFILDVYRLAAYQSDARPPFYNGDLCLRDGVPRVTDLATQKCGEDDFLVWNGLVWESLLGQFERSRRIHLVQKI